VPVALQARAIAVRSRSCVTPGNTGAVGSRSSRGGSVASTAANRSDGTEIQRPRRPFSTARRTRQRELGSSRSPQRRPFSKRFRFYRVRRKNLPETEAGGNFEALELDIREGLAESIHVVLFDGNVIGSEYNHYGPRATTLATFFNERLRQDVRLKQLVRQDIMNEILNLPEIRKIRIKASPTAAAALQGRATGFGGAATSADSFSAGRYLDLTLAAEPGDRQFTQRVKTFVRSLRRGDGRSQLEAAQVYGRNNDGLYETLDLLHDYVVLNREIERESPRSRSLDKAAAYRAVQDAYQEIQGELGAGGTISVEA